MTGRAVVARGFVDGPRVEAVAKLDAVDPQSCVLLRSVFAPSRSSAPRRTVASGSLFNGDTAYIAFVTNPCWDLGCPRGRPESYRASPRYVDALASTWLS
jgi:hypothetical protein